MWHCLVIQKYMKLGVLASEDAKQKKNNKKQKNNNNNQKKKKLILHPQRPLYLFYHFILQLTQHLSFYFYIQLIKII